MSTLAPETVNDCAELNNGPTEATEETAITVGQPNESSTDEGAVTPNSDWWDRAKRPPRPPLLQVPQ